jgi:hypothetical protein
MVKEIGSFGGRELGGGEIEEWKTQLDARTENRHPSQWAPLWKRRLVPRWRWTKGVSGRAGDNTESYSKKCNNCWRIIKLAVDCNGE